MDFVIVNVGIISPKSYSGGFEAVREVCSQLIYKKHHLIILTSKAGETFCKNMGIEADFWLIDSKEEMKTTNLLLISLEMVVRTFKAARLLKQKRFVTNTVVFAMSDLLWEVFPLIFVRKNSAIRVSSLHLTYPPPYRGYRGVFTNKLKVPSLRESLAYFQSRLAFICMKHSSDLFFSLASIKNYLTDRGITEDKIIQLKPGIKLDFINTIPLSGKIYDACWIGRYHPMKGCDDMLNIWHQVSETRKGTKLLIMGNVVQKLSPMVKKLHLEENVEFTGPISDETKFRLMKASKLLILPSYYESWCVVALEAMACGLPVVAYDLPVYHDIYTRGMKTVSIGDKKDFGIAVMNLLENDYKLETLSREALETAASYEHGWEDAVDRLLSKIKQIRLTLKSE
jgi:glycosyltransferase involved in cell wall biosynthesis